jgi:prepilin-type processing-associated H-X9-DG protein
MTAKFDPARYITEVRSVLGKIDATLPPKFDQGLGAAQMAIGRNLQTDILEPLGEDWAIYTASDVAGGGLMGMVVVNKLDDPKKAATGLPAFWNFVSSAAAMASKQGGNRQVTVQGQSTRIGDLTVYYLGTPLVSPSWAIKDGYLYMSLYPQNVASAAARTGSGKSIVESEAYQSLQKRLGVDKATAVSFTDLPKTAGASYQSLLMLFRATGVGDMFGVKVPEPLLPPLSAILPHLAPSGSASWVDEAGWHHKSVSPFPGSGMLGETGGVSTLAVPALGTSILLPSLNRARETANRVKCASNLRQIGQACLLYSNENRGKYPNDIAEIIRTQDITPQVFVCPSTGTTLPRGLQPAQLAQWTQENSNYVYVGKGLKNSATAETVVCYEKLEDHDNDGINVLFGDGHVEFIQREQAKVLIPDLAGGL